MLYLKNTSAHIAVDVAALLVVYKDVILHVQWFRHISHCVHMRIPLPQNNAAFPILFTQNLAIVVFHHIIAIVNTRAMTEVVDTLKTHLSNQL